MVVQPLLVALRGHQCEVLLRLAHHRCLPGARRDMPVQALLDRPQHQLDMEEPLLLLGWLLLLEGQVVRLRQVRLRQVRRLHQVMVVWCPLPCLRQVAHPQAHPVQHRLLLGSMEPLLPLLHQEPGGIHLPHPLHLQGSTDIKGRSVC
uniref:Uncharacterized protein n=1 Tax=Trieres chinensis TaxID=1514140 RepID=A0A7S2EX73_TRICV